MTNDIELTAESWTVSATETVSKDEYEPFKVHTSVSGSVGGDGRLDGETATWTVDPDSGSVRCTECYQNLGYIDTPTLGAGLG